MLTWPIGNWDGHTRVYLGDGWKMVQGIKPEADQQKGVQICGTGFGIFKNDGTVQKCDSLDMISVDLSIDQAGITVPDANCFEKRPFPGDSGGPTYALDSQGQALAAGITVASWKTSFYGIGTSWYWCYVTIDDALGVGGFQLPTGK
ncbi:MAG: hypothetical protein H6512_07695 [Acidimicrobiia bacterium]|nr:hypothetical protein [Acidimicrobiia bacterium]